MSRSLTSLGTLLAAAVVIALPSEVAAQSSPAILSPIAPAEGAAAPAGRLDAFLEGAGFELEINNDKPTATLSFGQRFDPWFSEEADGRGQFNQLSWTASFSAPIGGKDDLTDPQTLDKLSNGSTLTFGLSHFSFSNRDVGDRPSPTGAWQVGGEATVGFNDFKYREPLTLVEHIDDETPYAIGAFVAYYPSNSRSMVSGGVKYEYAFEAQEAVILCRPVVVVPADDCAQAPPGPPEQTEGFVFDLEYRQAFPTGWRAGDIAISPTVSYNESDGEFGVELPIYLLPPGKSPILPGIKLGYTSEEDEVTFGLFLKSSFSLSH